MADLSLALSFRNDSPHRLMADSFQIYRRRFISKWWCSVILEWLMALSFWNDWCRSFRKDWWFIISKCDADLTQIYRSAPYHFDMIFKQIDGRLFADLSQAKLSFWNDAPSHFEMMRRFFSSIWRWLSLRYEDDALFERKGLEALCLLSKSKSFLLSY